MGSRQNTVDSINRFLPTAHTAYRILPTIKNIMLNLNQVKKEICDIGDRIYKKGFAAGNDGNISYRISENQVVCTPTLVCKGYLKPDDLCIVDMEGKQLSGKRKRTSEVMLHLAIMKERPEVKSVVHCHPPHATAFGIAREPVPQCVLPEVEIFLGDVPITRYEIPGGQEFANTILPFVHKTNVIILANHGTVSFGETVEKAYWWTEILDAYCRILMLSRGLGQHQLLHRAGSEGPARSQAEMGLRRSPHRSEKLRYLRQRRLPQQLEGNRRGTEGIHAAELMSVRRQIRRRLAPARWTRKRSFKPSPRR